MKAERGWVSRSGPDFIPPALFPPIKDCLFGGEQSPVSGPPTIRLHGGTERRAQTGEEVLSKTEGG